MRRRWTITIIATLVVMLGGVAWHRCARTVPLSECSEVYRRYADTPGINAAYIKDYRVNDTLTISATLLEATYSASWALLKKDFGVINPKGVNINKGDDIIELIPNSNTTIHLDSTDIVTASYRDKNVLIFHTKNFKDKDFIKYAIFSYKISLLSK